MCEVVADIIPSARIKNLIPGCLIPALDPSGS